MFKAFNKQRAKKKAEEEKENLLEEQKQPLD